MKSAISMLALLAAISSPLFAASGKVDPIKLELPPVSPVEYRPMVAPPIFQSLMAEEEQRSAVLNVLQQGHAFLIESPSAVILLPQSTHQEAKAFVARKQGGPSQLLNVTRAM